jgi:hypothetical protein
MGVSKYISYKEKKSKRRKPICSKNASIKLIAQISASRRSNSLRELLGFDKDGVV